MFGFLIALLSGALMSIQGVLNTGLTRQTGIWLSAGWVQLTAFFTCLILWLFSERTPVCLTPLRTGPGHMASVEYLALLSPGPCFIRRHGRAGPRKSPRFLFVVTQIIIAYTIELFGWFGVEKAPFEWRKVLGALIAIGGIVLFHS